ncbi:hypothetical protein OPV22_001859 [Ensete ventricosum]|uniref:Uncharacterized protein n=1 Tax=Ensete ventricosum TaxID=4639 RepID=A0AAV8RS13_ENSVE|nr:hypothetical protein OPV22_001859 [Ensete ventricosum]
MRKCPSTLLLVQTILIQEDAGDDKPCRWHFADREVGDDLHPLRPRGNRTKTPNLFKPPKSSTNFVAVADYNCENTTTIKYVSSHIN